ncbi:uncharacterized protein LOC132743397 isoform X2 [Ruditapes philippinarum]|uniref:uncharacterized protein LOC132743397 isoform X2 n=1 Tax=Ruditapes philippinarum TaxID=129788 RepID=UPI00295B4456|nr:uncharacterized protein LOC132743397 isoform X2 [Ruditapes philippinarum]
MARPMKMYSTYSVFVGRFPPDTKKHELRDLFEGCGEIVDVVILDNSNGQPYGFVRFTNKDSALCAVSELNLWVFNGSNIIVALEKSTQVKIDKEKEGLLVTDGCGPRKKNDLRNQGRSRGTDFITDTMNWARLQESVTAVNLKHSNNNHLSMKKLSEDIDRVKDNRCTRLWGSVDDASTNFSQISSKIMQRCQAQGEKERGKKNCAEFMSALRTIMKEIEAVLGQKDDSNVEEIDDKELEEINQLVLEGKLVREVNEELEKEGEIMKSECDVFGRHTNETDRIVPKKRLSDASVQTVTLEEEYHIDVPDCLSDREITQSPRDRFDDFDPAIIDFHLSPRNEIKKKEKRREAEVNRSRATDKADIVQELYSKMNLSNGVVVDNNFERSVSRDSSISDDGVIDDSGVESDCFGGAKGRRSLGILDSMLGENGHYVDNDSTNMRRLHGSASEPSLRQPDHHQYLLKSRGRGNGSQLLNGQTSIPALGRGMLANLTSLKHPVGRGHHS